MTFPSKASLLTRSVLTNVSDFLRKQFRNPLPRIFPNFHRWSNFRRHFLQNLLIGIGIEVIVVLLHNWGPVLATQNAVLDSMMAFSADNTFEDSKRPTQIFIDVDEETYRSQEWGPEPNTLPLDNLAVLIKGAFASGARYVLVDFAIDGLGNKGTGREQQEEFICKMKEALAQHPDKHLLFVRTLRQPLESSTVKTVRPSVLDELIISHPDQVHAVAPNFLRSADQVLRHWRLWESACYQLPDKQGKQGESYWGIVPSPQLAIASLENGVPLPWHLFEITSDKTRLCAVDSAKPDSRSARKADWLAGDWVWTNLGKCYEQDSFKAASCGNPAKNPDQQLENETPVEIEAEALANRILFRQPDLVRKHLDEKKRGETPTIISYGPYFDRFPALELLTGSPIGRTDTALGKLKKSDSNKSVTIAIIGASYEDSRDTHLTPLGEMPGSLVLVNAIDTLQTVGILQSPPSWQKYSSVILLLVSISTVFALLSALAASIFMIAIILLVFGPLNFLLLKHGIWLDFGAPIIGIYLHREWEGLLERLSGKAHH